MRLEGDALFFFFCSSAFVFFSPPFFFPFTFCCFLLCYALFFFYLILLFALFCVCTCLFCIYFFRIRARRAGVKVLIFLDRWSSTCSPSIGSSYLKCLVLLFCCCFVVCWSLPTSGVLGFLSSLSDLRPLSLSVCLSV